MVDGDLLFNTKIDTSAFDTLAVKAGSAVTKITAAFSGLVGAAGKVGSSFEAEMSAVESISLESAENMALLTEKAEQMGATTKFTATESGKAFEYMAMAGWKTEQMLDGIDGIMNLAAASGEDLALVSDIVTDALTAFGMTAAESGHFADILAAASSNANTNVAMLGESFKYVAPIFGSLQWSAEDAAVALGLMANAGIKSTQAGTSLRAAISSLAAPTEKVSEMMDKYGISLTDESGKMLSFADVMLMLRDRLGSLSEAEQAAAASILFGREAMSGMLAIINASDEDYDKLTNAVENCSGAVDKMSEIRLDNLQGDVTILMSGLEALGIAAYNKFNEPLRDAVQSVTKEVEKLTESIKDGELSESFEKVAVKLTELAGKFLEFAANKGIPALINAFEWVIDNGDKVVSMLETIGAGYAAAKILAFGMKQQAIIGGTTIAEQAGLIAGSLVNPTTAAVALAAAIALAGTALINYGQARLAAKNEAMAYSLREELDAVRDLQSAYDDARESAREKASEEIAEADRTKALWTELNRYVDSSGNVIKNKERVKELTEQINAVIPGTISLIGDEITNYHEAAAAIDEYVNAKKNQAVLDYLGAGYGEAMANVDDLSKAFAETEKERDKLRDQTLAAEEAYYSKRDEVAKQYYDWAISQHYSEAQAQEYAQGLEDVLKDTTSELYQLKTAYDKVAQANADNMSLWSEQKTMLDTYYDTIGEYEGLTKALAEGDNDAFEAILRGLSSFGKEYSEMSSEELENDINTMIGVYEDRKKRFEAGKIPEWMVDQARQGLSKTIELAKDYIYATGKSVEGVVFTAGDYYKRQGMELAAKSQAEYAAFLGKNGLSPELAEAAEDVGSAAADEIDSGFKDAVDDLKFSVEIGDITDDQYKEQLGGLLEKYDSGRTKAYREYWDDYTKWKQKKAEEAAEEQKRADEKAEKEKEKQLEKEKKENDDAADKILKKWQENADSLVDTYTKRYQEIVQKRDSMISNLSSELYKKVDEDDDEDDSEYELADQKKQKKKLDEYEKLLEKLRKANASDDFMAQFTSLDLDAALDFGEALSSARGGTSAYLKSWQENHEREKQLAADLCRKSIDELNAEFEPKFSELLKNVPTAFSENGIESMQGYIDGLESKSEDADAEVKTVMDSVIEACRNALDIHSPSKVMYEIGEYTVDGFSEGLRSKAQEVYDTVEAVFGSAFDEMYARFSQAVRINMSADVSNITASSMPVPTVGNSVSAAFPKSGSTVSGNDFNLYLNNEYFGKMVRRSVSSPGILTATSGGVY